MLQIIFYEINMSIIVCSVWIWKQSKVLFSNYKRVILANDLIHQPFISIIQD